jgi:hypothetical protein
MAAAASASASASPSAVAESASASAAGSGSGGLLVHNAHILSGVALHHTPASAAASASAASEEEGAEEGEVKAVVGATYRWMSIRHGRIEAVGATSPPPAAVRQSCSAAVDAGGAHIWPGLADAHIHVLLTGKLLSQVDCSRCELTEMVARVKAAAVQMQAKEAQAEKQEQQKKQQSQVQVLCGFGWDQDSLGRYPNRQDLDAALAGVSGGPQRPVLLMRACQHIAVVNTYVPCCVCVCVGVRL